MSDAVRARADDDDLVFEDARGVAWTTGRSLTASGSAHRWFRAPGRRERRYEIHTGEAADESIASLRQQLHASVAIKSSQ
jgi:hypothetical protein